MAIEGPNQYRVEFKSVTQVFGHGVSSKVALKEVSFRVVSGAVHAIIGENGAGKTTLMNLLHSRTRPTSGSISTSGSTGMVHQHFKLAGSETAWENAELVGPHFFLSRNRAVERLERIARTVGFEIPWDVPVERLAVGVQQRIEILKVLSQGADTLIFDEPTAVMTPSEVDQFLALLRQLAGSGKTVLLITHKLREVLEVATHVTVLRRGAVVADAPLIGVGAKVSESQLAEWMIGDLPEKEPDRGAARSQRERGKILGVAGVDGNGQDEYFEELTRDRRAPGREEFGVVPADRHRRALLLERTLLDNAMLSYPKRTRAEVGERMVLAMEEFDVRPRGPGALSARAGDLSGGNQQKFVVARELLFDPKLLIAAQVTRGVDIGAARRIHSEILKRRDAGMSAVIFSSDLDEIRALSDQIVVMVRGRRMGPYDAQSLSDAELGLAMGGVEPLK